MVTLLVDISHLAYRTFFALPPLSYDEENSQMIYGVLSSLISSVRKQPVSEMFIVEDRGHTSKDEIYPEYKQKKGDPLDQEQRLDFNVQFEKLTKFFNLLGVKRCYASGAEADDVIAYLCTNRSLPTDNGDYIITPPILILSGDHDLHCLLSEEVSMWKPHKEALYTVEQFQQDFPEIMPKQYREILTLTGCSSDNVPGVKGIGPKYATKLIQKYGSVDNILSASEDDRLVDLVKQNRDMVELSRKLVTYAEVTPVLEKYSPDISMARKFLFALGMESLIDKWSEVVRLTQL